MLRLLPATPERSDIIHGLKTLAVYVRRDPYGYSLVARPNKPLHKNDNEKHIINLLEHTELYIFAHIVVGAWMTYKHKSEKE